MPLPLLFIGIAAATGASGISSTVRAGVNQYVANTLNENAEERIVASRDRLEVLRHQCENSLESLGQEKVYVLNNSVQSFLTAFRSLKNVDFKESSGLEELKKLKIDKKDFDALEEMSSFAGSLASGTAAGAAGGAMAAYGAYSAAATFATASTGTAISGLSGVAASNATLAFFGGGSLAAGGLGVAGGTAVLGGLVAGPALLVMGTISKAKAGKNLEIAKMNSAEADKICAELEAGGDMCMAIRRRSYMFYSLLARLDAYFLPLIFEMEEIIKTSGVDYSKYSKEQKATVAKAASIATSIKAVLDTPILTEKGNLTKKSERVVESTNETLVQLAS